MNKTVKAALMASCLGVMYQAQAQMAPPKSIFDNLSIEIQYGLNNAISPTDGITSSDYSGFHFFQAGFTYHIDDVWGVRGSFAQTKFTHKDIDGSGVKYSKLTLEATYNILTAINNLQQPFDVVAHAGLGLGVGKSEPLLGEDLIGVAQIGLMPTYRFNTQFAVFLDGTYVNHFSQNFGFDGLAIKQGSASYLNVGLGLQYRFKGN